MAAWTLSRAGLRARRAALGGATRMSAGADCTPASFSQPPGTSPPAVGTRGQAAWGVTSQVAGSRGGPVTCLVEDIGRRGSGLLANELCTVLSEDSRVCPSPRRPQERLNTQRPRCGANQDSVQSGCHWSRQRRRRGREPCPQLCQRRVGPAGHVHCCHEASRSGDPGPPEKEEGKTGLNPSHFSS